MTKLKLPLVLLAIVATNVHAATPCSYAPLAIEPSSAARNDVFSGQGKRIEVSFANEATTQPVETFPESNLKIRQLRKKSACEVEGGIWVRNSVYLSMDEQTLIAKQFSGSNESLSFYDTQTCALKAEVDVSNRAWQIEPRGLRLGEHCASDELTSCKKTVLKRWSTHCLVRVAKKH